MTGNTQTQTGDATPADYTNDGAEDREKTASRCFACGARFYKEDAEEVNGSGYKCPDCGEDAHDSRHLIGKDASEDESEDESETGEDAPVWERHSL